MKYVSLPAPQHILHGDTGHQLKMLLEKGKKQHKIKVQ